MIILYSLLALFCIFFGFYSLVRKNRERIFSIILILLGIQFSFEILEMLSLIYFQNNNTSLNFSVVQMAQNKINLIHFYILCTGILSFIFGNYIYRNFIWKRNKSQSNQYYELSSNSVMLFFIIPGFILVMIFLYQFIAFFGGLSNIFENINSYRTGSSGGQGSGYLIYPR